MALIVNKSNYKGVFPRKGRKCVKMISTNGTVRWIPINNREIILAEAVESSAAYIPATSVVAADIAHVEEHDYLRSRVNGERLLPMNVIPSSGVTLAVDMKMESPNRSYRTIPAGSRIFAGSTGDIYSPAIWWVKEPESEAA